MIKRLASLICLGIAACGGAGAQYYDWGQGPASEKWRSIRTPNIRYIFPTEFERQTVRLMQYFDTIRPHIGHGFTHGPMPGMPLIVRAQNFNSNGIVMLAPQRIELIVTPGADMPAFPWLKQLAAHEYRHAVQYNNLNRGIVRVLSRILGQQGSMVGLALMPVWALEGDAVLAETQMSSFGRGLQPSYTIEYRAMALEGGGRRTIDKYFCGSFRDFMPDHYKLGYQITAWSDTHFGGNIWDKVAWYNSRNAYLLFPTSISLRRFYDTSVDKLFTDTFDELDAFWRSQPDVRNSARIIPTPVTSYTSYTFLDVLYNTVVAVKSDLDRAARLVRVDIDSGDEHVMTRIGSISSGVEIANGKVWWTEFRQSTFWQQRVNSQLCSFDLTTGRKQTYRDRRQALFPTALPNGDMATVRYNREGSYTIESGRTQWNLPDTVSIHGLAYEQITDKLYFIGLSNGGMWIGSVAEGERGFQQVTRAGYTSIASLSAGAGKLYFSSIASGKDEAHVYDLAQGREYRISTSRYGSFAPSESRDGVVMTTYTPQGYLLSTQRTDSLTEVPYSPLPQNVVNPPRRSWDVINLDHFTASGETPLPVKKYRRGLHLFNFHSWAPFYFEPDRVVSEGEFNVRAGVTVMSQNHLNTAFTQFGYAWTGQHSLLHGKFSYLGWAPKFDLEAKWSNRPQDIYGGGFGIPRPSPGNYLKMTARGYLPMLLSAGSMFRSLTPAVEYQFTNSKIYSRSTARYELNDQQVIFSLQYTENARLAHRDFLPRIGYAARVRYTSNPFSDDFGKMWSFYGRTFLPGAAPHHSLMLQGAYQTQSQAMWAFRRKELFPRGADFSITPQQYAAFSGDYQFPLWYPDGGINSIVYFRRIRLNLGGDFARYRNFPNSRIPRPDWQNIWSYGGDITFDIVPLRMPSNTSTSLTFSIRKPSDSKSVVVGFSVSMPI